MFEMLLGGKPSTPQGSVVKAMAGGADLLALSHSGKLYGVCSIYLSGTGVATTTWTKILDDVDDFWVGFRQCIARMKDGRWLFWGVNTLRMAGITSGATVVSPTDVSSVFSVLTGQSIKQITMSNQSFVAVFNDGRYAMMGSNTNGGQATGDNTAVGAMVIRSDYNTVVKAQLAPVEDTTYILLANGTVLGVGQSLYGQLNVVGQTAITGWRVLSTATTTYDIVSGYSCIFSLRDPGGSQLQVWGQGRQFDGSLGTGQTATTNVAAHTSVATMSSAAGRQPLYVGTYTARYFDPTGVGRVWFTGTSSAVFGWNTAAGFPAGSKYVFTQAPVGARFGPFFQTINGYTAIYILDNGNLYGAGSPGSSGLLPGYTTPQQAFVSLDTSAIV